MLEKLFAFIRNGVRDAILGGIDDAGEVIAGRIGIEGDDAKLIEATEPEPKPKSNGRRRTAASK